LPPFGANDEVWTGTFGSSFCGMPSEDASEEVGLMLGAGRATTVSPPSAFRSVSLSASWPRIPALTGVRFFAAFFILFAHAADWLGQFQNSDIQKYFSFVAMYGMPLFFVLSGFVIHYNYRKLFLSRRIGWATCEFAAARFARLFPLYIALLVVAIAADNFRDKVHGQGNLWAKILAYDVTLTQSWWYVIYDGQSVINWLFPLAWSISTEMFFYAAFVPVVFLILALRTARYSIIAACCYAIIVTSLLVTTRYFLPDVLRYAQRYVPDYIGLDHFNQSFFRWLFYFSPYLRVLEFIMGCLAAHAFMLCAHRPVTKTERSMANVALALALVTLGFFGVSYLGFVSYGELDAYVQFLALNFLCAPLIGFVLFYLGRYDTAFTRFMSSPLLVLLGDTSYSMYLIHTWTLRLFTRPPAPAVNWFWIIEAMLRATCGIALTLIVSYGTYKIIEVPSRAWLRRMLDGLITTRIGDAEKSRITSPPTDRLESMRTELVTPFRASLVFSGASIAFLAAIVVAGQTVRSNYVAAKVHRLWYGNRLEISVDAATYGLNCSNFSVPANFPKLTTRGNVSDAVKRFCDGQTQCKFTVNVLNIGDPANGCGKEFEVEYHCTDSDVRKSALLPAEANGKTLTFDCQSEKTE
jgi:peptidoglycan/LPS O-acetylase OafA/YrhL